MPTTPDRRSPRGPRPKSPTRPAAPVCATPTDPNKPGDRDCLGGIRKHKFFSPSGGHRICANCRQRIDERCRGVSPTMYEPYAVASGGGKPGNE